MRIAVFSTDDHLPPAGGAEIAMGEIMARCPEHTFDLFCARLRPTAPNKEEKGNVTIHRVGIGIPSIDKILLAFTAARQAYVRHRAQPYHLVWGVLASYGGFAASRLKQKTKLPFLLTLQEGTETELIEWRTFFVRPWFKSIFKSADGLQAISSYLLAWGKRMGFRGSVATIIPNGVALENYQPISKNEKAEIRQQWDVKPDETLLITVSRLVPKNGVGDIITALKQLPNHVRLLICGDGPLRNSLQGLTRQLGLDSRAIFAGFVPHTYVPSLLAASDVFVRPSISEGLGNAFLEAMAAGIPTVGTAVGGIPDFLHDGETGFLCKPKNPDDLARVIRHILAMDPQERESIVKKARVLVGERFTWETIADNMRNLFLRLT